MSLTNQHVLMTSVLPGIEPAYRGKVREVYTARGNNGADRLIVVASDRISAFDCILPNGIPLKGEVLTRLSIFWFDFLKDFVKTHFISSDVASFPDPFDRFPDQLRGRSMLVHRAEMFPIECVARGYLAGSGWKEYRQSGTVCGIPLPAGLQDGSQLSEPIFTPATKAQSGHDENVSFAQISGIIGNEMAERLRNLTLSIYSRASAYAADRGIIIADTKFEFGLHNGEIILADEVLTPDSSRFWPQETWQPGHRQFSYDKQFVRDYLETLTWDKIPPAPLLPPEVIEKTSAKYAEAFRLLTGRDL